MTDSRHGNSLGHQASTHVPLDARATVEELAEEYLACLRGGQPRSIDSFVEQYPDLKDEIRELFPTLAMLEEFAPDENDLAARQATTMLHASMPARLGEYRILREIGRGGMGVVYEAEHDTMRRRVAVKVLPREAADRGTNLERFLREARAAGRLHHTNIVPVFEVGSDCGVHFYSMQYIDGQNLDAVLEELRRFHASESGSQLSTQTATASPQRERNALSQSIAHQLISGERAAAHADQERPSPVESMSYRDGSAVPRQKHSTSTRVSIPAASELTNVGESNEGYFRRIARVGLQVAEAMKYAHGQGVLHRDIKPSNLILDTEGVVWVTDFGLAKHQDEDFTRSGDIVGTLRYMAPERFRGKVDARSDLYGLGLTLYELCTLHDAFDRSNHAHIMQQVTRDTPIAPRKHNRQIPRDLETIILKSIDKEPTHRYATAGEMADDLRRFIDDLPIRARRSSIVERTWRWCRRNPAQAALASCVLLLLVLLAAGSLYFGYSSREHAAELEQENERALMAEREVREANDVAKLRLYQAHLGQARAGRWSSRPGQHFETLAALSEAAQLLPELKMSGAQLRHERDMLRNEAIAAMPLFDVKQSRQWKVGQQDSGLVAFTASYDRYAQAALDGSICVRRVEDDKLLHRYEGPGEKAWVLRFSEDGRYLAAKFHESSSNEKMRVWDVSNDRLILESDHQGPAKGDVVFSPESTRLAVIESGSRVNIYSLPDTTLLNECTFGAAITDIAFHPEGDQFAVSTARGVLLLETVGQEPHVDLVTPESLRELTLQPAHYASSVAWTRDRVIGGAPNGLIRVWDPARKNAPLLELDGHERLVGQLNASHDGQLLLSRSWDGSTRIWDLLRGREALRVDFLAATRSSFSSDDRTIGYTGRDSQFGIWQVSRGGPLSSLGQPGHGGVQWTAQFHPTRPHLVASANNAGVSIWDARTNELRAHLDIGATQAMMFAPDGKSLLTSNQRGLYRFPLDLHEGLREEVTFGKGTQILDGLCARATMSRDGSTIAVDRGDQRAAVVPLADPGAAIVLDGHPLIDRAVLSPHGEYVATATWGGHGVRIWNAKDGKMLLELPLSIGNATPAFSPDGQWLAVGAGDVHSIWRVGSWELVHRIPRERPDGWPGPCAFSPDSHTVAFSYTRSAAQLLDVESGRRLAILEPPQRVSLGSCTWSNDGKQVLFTEDSFLQIWNIDAVKRRLAEMNLGW